MVEHITRAVKFSTAITPTAGAAAQTAINGTTLDMQDYDAFCVYVRMGAIAGTAVTSLKVEQSAAADMSNAEDIAGSNIAIADDDDDEIFISDHFWPSKRYVRVVISRGTANATVAEAHYLQYSADAKPVTQPASGVTIERFKNAVGGAA